MEMKPQFATGGNRPLGAIPPRSPDVAALERMAAALEKMAARPDRPRILVLPVSGDLTRKEMHDLRDMLHRLLADPEEAELVPEPEP